MADRIRLTHLIPDVPVGGAEQMVLNLVGALDRRRYEVAVVSLYAPTGSAIERDLERVGVRLVHLGKHLGLDIRMFARIASALRELRPDVLHSHRNVLQYALPTLALSPPRGALHTVHNEARRELPRALRVPQRLAFALGVQAVATGQGVARSFREVYGREPAAVIQCGIPVERYATPGVDRKRWREREGLDPDVLVVACVARLAPQKNLATLLRAFARIERSREPVLLVAGDGPLRDALAAEARALALGERVRFLGARADVPDLLAASDILAMSSLWEANPLAIMEAMAAGLPVVATASGGIPELVRHGETGLLVAPGDEVALAAALGLLAQDARLRRELGAAGRRRARAELDVAVMARAYDGLYRALLDRPVLGRPTRRPWLHRAIRSSPPHENTHSPGQ